jgi:hypothetical protein
MQSKDEGSEKYFLSFRKISYLCCFLLKSDQPSKPIKIRGTAIANTSARTALKLVSAFVADPPAIPPCLNARISKAGMLNTAEHMRKNKILKNKTT